MPRPAGHREGVKSVRRVVESCRKHQIEALTLFAFSSENWRRPKTEVSLLMDLFISTLQKEVDSLHGNGVRVCFIGDRTPFSKKLRQLMDDTERLTLNNPGLRLAIAVNYGGRWDIAQAARQIAARVQAGELALDAIDADLLGQQLSLAGLPEPDLFIRTGGEQRISNFLLWQLAYTELYFTDTLWPDFDEQSLLDALTSFAQRQRRFGQTGDQVERIKGA
jgi:undecaprenyl diphosphate synthase